MDIRSDSSTYTVRGTTLLEVLLSVALLAIIAGGGAFAFSQMYIANQRALSIGSIEGALFQAYAYASAAYDAAPWGVYIATSSVTVFRGESYMRRDTAHDVVSDLAGVESVSGTQEYVFNTGTATTTAATTTLIRTGIPVPIYINQYGILTIQ